jgi:hypothetical protein
MDTDCHPVRVSLPTYNWERDPYRVTDYLLSYGKDSPNSWDKPVVLDAIVKYEKWEHTTGIVGEGVILLLTRSGMRLRVPRPPGVPYQSL